MLKADDDDPYGTPAACRTRERGNGARVYTLEIMRARSAVCRSCSIPLPLRVTLMINKPWYLPPVDRDHKDLHIMHLLPVDAE
nr:hypothetical protein CFP56_55993 [Quercus suber]